MRSTFQVTLVTAVLFSMVAVAFPFESSALRHLKQFGASSDVDTMQTNGWTWKSEDALSDLPCSILRHWDLPIIAPDLVLSTSYSMVGILAALNTNIKPHIEDVCGFWFILLLPLRS